MVNDEVDFDTALNAFVETNKHIITTGLPSTRPSAPPKPQEFEDDVTAAFKKRNPNLKLEGE